MTNLNKQYLRAVRCEKSPQEVQLFNTRWFSHSSNEVVQVRISGCTLKTKFPDTSGRYWKETSTKRMLIHSFVIFSSLQAIMIASKQKGPLK